MTAKIVKTFNVRSKTVDLEAGIFEAMISTETADRQGDIVRAAGAQVGNYLKNPVVLWAHDYGQPPVAKALQINRIPGVGIRARFQFPPAGTSAKADEVRQLWAAGFLNATSIGFIPLKWANLEEDSWGAKEYISWELLEFSIVPVPANQEALRLAMKTLRPNFQQHDRRAIREKLNEGLARCMAAIVLEDEEDFYREATSLLKYMRALE